MFPKTQSVCLLVNGKKLIYHNNLRLKNYKSPWKEIVKVLGDNIILMLCTLYWIFGTLERWDSALQLNNWLTHPLTWKEIMTRPLTH